jgi:catalase
MPVPPVRRSTMAAIAMAPIALVAAFAWAGGWIGPSRVNGPAIANALEYNAGKHSGYRRAHAKGLCVSGYFDANGAGTSLSTAHIFVKGHYPAFGRFSTGGGNPLATDGRNVFHAFGLELATPDGQKWRLAMDHVPIFPVATPQDFVALQIATKPDPATGKPVPAVMKAYLKDHPETKAFQDYMKSAPLPDSFANGTYYSINAFRFINGAGASKAVRWAFVPESPLGELDKDKLDSLPRDYLFNEMVQRLAKGPMRWRLVVTIAAPGDPTDKATVEWPAGRQQVDVGMLTLNASKIEENGTCRDTVFDPTILPKGMALSDDPLPAARSAAYAASFRRRAIEGAQPSAIGMGQAAKSAKEKE